MECETFPPSREIGSLISIALYTKKTGAKRLNLYGKWKRSLLNVRIAFEFIQENLLTRNYGFRLFVGETCRALRYAE